MMDINVLVLGSRVRDGHPQAMLASRLRRAQDLVGELRRAGHCPLLVVSGRGEAEVMRDWLVGRGMDPGRIVVEPEATSTNENLERAHALLPETGRWFVVTNDFHVLRARLWAWHLNLPVTMVAAPTPARSRLRNYLRETIATPHSAVRVLWRKFRGWLDAKLATGER